MVTRQAAPTGLSGGRELHPELENGVSSWLYLPFSSPSRRSPISRKNFSTSGEKEDSYIRIRGDQHPVVVTLQLLD